ncbi:uncharacterized protein LOC122381952 [Amphibalanus amphitrite]|uniref:uncharacterized protein LOC122381952 n=1 Tax=Amphibalanus amphitrite TaxID=1232801 RepID=UPI001C914635|nr:uncharacterized protein LOC122381952 [Amphibalanus amphitrite]
MNPEDIALAEQVQRRIALWDIRDKGYRLKPIQKQHLWAEIAEELHKDEQELKRRWRNIRDYYRSLRHSRAAPSGSAALPPLTTLQLGYMRYLSFLNPVLEAKTTCTSLQQPGATPLTPDESAATAGNSFDSIFESELQTNDSTGDGLPPTADDPDNVTQVGAPSDAPRRKARQPLKKRRITAADRLEQEVADAVAEVRQLQNDKHEPFLRSASQLLDKMDEAACARWKVKALAELTALAYPPSEGQE